MSKTHIGGRPPRYSFLLNPYQDVRFTRCPKCQRLTNLRKFALLIHLEGRGLIALGKTSRFCAFCDLIMVHQDELESEIARIFPHAPSKRLNYHYFVIGTLPLSLWKSSLRNRLSTETVRHLASDFKNQLKIRPLSDA